jgi:hypothetical protein
MKKSMIIATAALLAGASVSHAGIIASWGFESLTINGGSDPGTISPDVGTGLLFKSQLDPGVYATPDGNGSAKSFSSSRWSGTSSGGDTWEVRTSTAGQSNIQLQFDLARSAGGPPTFKVQYSSTGFGGPFIDLPGGVFSVPESQFSPTTANLNNRFQFDLSSITALNNNPNAVFLIKSTSSGQSNSDTATIDNVIVGNNLPAIPEPATLGVLAAGSLVMLRRRK